ncbi:fumarylacetoacetate hydrolase family protein [Microbacterium album]|uniref:Hydroxylase n=1 Tax=Microbacterium album TaxID=2053191 RepID=A0A917IHF1_9MICO|nr:fumarylacetoacetate hydrolase family protein [Microbacterium album]GGH51557.1 hydroxylase [Microbacterium album]
MRIARWTHGDELEEGFVIDGRVVPFSEQATVQTVLATGLAAAHDLFDRADAATGVPLKEVRLLPPVVPTTIRDFAAFEEHVEGMTADAEGNGHVPAEWYEAPTFYFTNPHTVLGPNGTVRPPVSERLDFELEVAAVIGGVAGSDGANLDPESAAAHIFGFTIMNDWSARDLQAREMRVLLGPAKGKDFGTTLGPWIVTADELEPHFDRAGLLSVRAEVRVNGTLVGDDLVSNMGWTFPELVAYASRNSRVVPGDVFGSGTVGNGGCLGELWSRTGVLAPPPLTAGDEIRMTVEGIGDLVGFVGEPVPAPPLPPARRNNRPRHR